MRKKGCVYRLSVLATRVFPEHGSDLLFLRCMPPKRLAGYCRCIRWTLQVVITGNAHENRMRTEFCEVRPQERQFCAHDLKLLRASSLHEVSGEENDVPRTCRVGQDRQILEELLSHPWPEPVMRLTDMPIGQVKPIQSGRHIAIAAKKYRPALKAFWAGAVLTD